LRDAVRATRQADSASTRDFRKLRATARDEHAESLLAASRVPRESLPDPKVDADPDRALITLLPMQRSMSKKRRMA